MLRTARSVQRSLQHRATIRRASHDDPVDEAHFNLALVLRAEGKYAEAEKQLQRALSIDPKYALAREVLTTCDWRSNSSRRPGSHGGYVGVDDDGGLTARRHASQSTSHRDGTDLVPTANSFRNEL
jgi:tetratricopeptide (TPR) repeat protein